MPSKQNVAGLNPAGIATPDFDYAWGAVALLKKIA